MVSEITGKLRCFGLVLERGFTIAHLVHLLVPRQVGRHIHGQPISPSNQRYSRGLLVRREFLHPHHEVVHILVHDRLQGPQEPAAEGRGDLPGHAAMSHGIFLPDEAAEALAPVLEVGLDEILQVLVLRRVDVREGLGREEGQLVGRDPDGPGPVPAQGALDRPGPPPGEPVVGIPEVGDGGESRSREVGKGVKVEQVDGSRQCICDDLRRALALKCHLGSSTAGVGQEKEEETHGAEECGCKSCIAYVGDVQKPGLHTSCLYVQSRPKHEFRGNDIQDYLPRKQSSSKHSWKLF